MQGLNPTTRASIAVRDSAMSGDIAYRVSPATMNRPATAAAWTQKIVVELVNSAGKVHDWFNGAIATAASVADASALGTATINATTLTFVNGVAELTLSGDAAAWVALETATVTIAQKTILGATVTAKTHVTTIV
jgi:hypothetical protein